MEVINEKTKRKVISLKLLGHTNMEIAKMTGISTGSVSNITNNLEELFGSDTEFAMGFFRDMRKRGLSIEQVLEASSLLARFQSLGLDSDYVKTMCEPLNRSKEEGIEPKELVDSTSQLFQLCKSLGIKPENLPGHIKKLEEDMPKKRHELADLEKKTADALIGYEQNIKNAREELVKILEDKKKIENKLGEYQRAREALTKHNLQIKDIEKLARMVDKAKQDGFKIKRVIKYLKSQDTISYLHSQLHCLGEQYKKKKSDLSRLWFEISSTTLNYTDCNELLPRVKELVREGVTLDELLFLHKAIQSTEGTVDELGRTLEQFGNLNKAVKQKNESLLGLKSEEAELVARIEGLVSQKNSLEASINEVKEKGVKEIEYIKKEVSNSIVDINTNAKKSLEDSKDHAKRELDELAAATKSSLNSITEEMEKEKQRCVAASIEFGKMEALLPIFKLFKQEKVSKNDALISILTLLERFRFCDAFKCCNGFLRRSVDDLVNKVRDELASSAI